MADIDTQIRDFLQSQDDTLSKWYLYVVNPFSTAYDNAYTSLQSYIKLQEKVDEARQKFISDMFMLALSLCGGGLLTAAFGSAALKTVLSNDNALRFLYRNNFDRAFSAATFVAQNKTASFIAGKLWDEAEKRATDAITDEMKHRLEEIPSNFPSLQQLGTMPMRNTLENYILAAKVKNADIAKGMLENTSMKLDERQKSLAQLKSSPFMQPPKTSVDNGKLSEQIELGFYMTMVTKSDKLWIYEKAYRRISDGLGHGIEPYYKVNKVVDITDSTTSPEYMMMLTTLGNGRELKFEMIGDVIRKRINELYKKYFGSDFMGKSLNFGHLWQAERAISSLANINIARLIPRFVSR